LAEFLVFARSWQYEEQYGRVMDMVCLGDVIDRGYHPLATVNILKGIKNLKWVRGNHDEAAQMGESICQQDMMATLNHQAFILDGGSSFVDYLPDHIVDPVNKYYAVHGGPVDPESLYNNIDPTYNWLSQRTWQRMTNVGLGFDYSGWRVTPEMAFQHASKCFDGDGWMIVSGHDHNEGCYTWDRNRRVREMMPMISKRDEVNHVKLAGLGIREKHIAIEKDKDYILTIGALGAERPGHYGILKTGDNGEREFIFCRAQPQGEFRP
jgi:hypothetical protein